MYDTAAGNKRTTATRMPKYVAMPCSGLTNAHKGDSIDMDGNTYTMPTKATAAMVALTHQGSKLRTNRIFSFFRGISGVRRVDDSAGSGALFPIRPRGAALFVAESTDFGVPF